jgi:hypothetical protein
MLMRDLGFRQPDEGERQALAEQPEKPGRSGAAASSLGKVPAAVLHADPLISYSGIARGAPLGLASLLPGDLRDRPAWFLLSPTWSMESAHVVRKLRASAVLHREQAPRHNLIFICNTHQEEDLLREAGEAAFFYNKTANTPEWIFKPLGGVRVAFDAIYNAQLMPFKRHELSLEIPRCAFLYYRDLGQPDAAMNEAAIRDRHAALAPGHRFINRLDKRGVPIRLSPSKVNRHLNSAAVGLCLSEKEGAMFASTEYLLSGLPVVSTPSTGGREAFYDKDYCLVVDPKPRAIAEAVAALKARRIPRQYVRERTMQRIEEARSRFIGLINDILEAAGATDRLSATWPFRKTVIMEWLEPATAVDHAVNGVVDAFEKKADEPTGDALWRRWARMIGLGR